MRPRPSRPQPLPPEVEAWLATQPPHAREELRRAWHLSGGTYGVPQPNPARRQATWTRLAAYTTRGDRAAASIPLRHISRVVLPLAIILLLALALWPRPTTLHAPIGQTASATLPDGSNVALNSGSTITYTRAFGHSDRTVQLEGEAFFDVLPAAVPFVVKTHNAHIEVVGTRFNVRARKREGAQETLLSVSSGTVHLAPLGEPAGAVRLEAGQASTVYGTVGAPSPPAPFDTARVSAWRQGGFFFDNQPLGLIFDEVERRFALSIAADPAVRAIRFTLIRHRVDDAREVLQDLCQANGLRFRETANGFEVYRA
jgi:transmembrane sensor